VADRLPVRLHPRAEDDAAAAYRWYVERNPTIAEIFLVEINSAIERIAETPRRWPRIAPAFQRCPLGRFPFSVVYRQTSRHIEILAIAHHRRRPGFWAGR